MRVKIIYKSVKGVFQYFCFPDKPEKGGDILYFYKGGNLRKGGLDVERGGGGGGYEPPYQLFSLYWLPVTVDKDGVSIVAMTWFSGTQHSSSLTGHLYELLG